MNPSFPKPIWVCFALVLAATTKSTRLEAVDSVLSAESHLAAVDAFYRQSRTIRARFEQAYFHKIYNRYERSSGHVVFAKPGRMRWDYKTPTTKVIISDGQSLTVYDPPTADQKRGQAIRRPWRDNELSHALAFLMGTGSLKASFTAQLIDEAVTGASPPSWVALALTPRSPQKAYQKLVIYVDKDATRRGLVRRVVLIDHLGNRNRFDFHDVIFNEKIPEYNFKWKPPAQTDWIS